MLPVPPTPLPQDPPVLSALPFLLCSKEGWQTSPLGWEFRPEALTLALLSSRARGKQARLPGLPKQLLTFVWLRNAQHSPAAMGLHLLKRPLPSSETFCCVLELAVKLYRTQFSTALGADAVHLSHKAEKERDLASSTLKAVQRRAS